MNADTHIPLKPFWTPLVIRIATAGDQASLRGLAELDSVEPLTGAALIAEVGERLVAAISLDTRREIADPFVPTSDVLELLRIRARQLTPRLAPRDAFATRRSTRTPLVRSLRLLLR